MGIINQQSQPSVRRGLSFLEFVGCLVAMSGGVILGSMYLGIDIQKMAIGVLVQAQVVDAGFFQQSTQEQVTEAGSESLAAETAVTNSAPSEQGSLNSTDKSDQHAANGAAKQESNSTETAGPTQLTADEIQAATRVYWNTLTECMLVEAQGRLRGEGSPEEWQLYDYLSQRKNGHEQALESLQALDERGVDDRLVAHGQQVVTWHKSGVKLFDHVLSLLSDGPGAKLTGPFAQSWQSAATQLRMEEKIVLDRHNAVANYLDREYAAAGPFVPALQQQFTK